MLIKQPGLLPYEVGRFAYIPGSRPYIFYLVMGAGAPHVPGILEKIVRVFRDKGVPILQLKISAPTGGRGGVIVIADLKGREDLAESLSKELSGVELVEKVYVIAPIINGISVDTLSFPLTLMGQRAVILRQPLYEGFIKGVWKQFGSAGAILLYLAGFEAGRLAYRDHARLTEDPSAQLALAQALFQMLGYGVLELVKVDDERREAVARVHDSFECELFRGAGEVRGGFVRGLIAGWLAGRWGVSEEREILAREVKCIAKGDPYCEYHVRAERK